MSAYPGIYQKRTSELSDLRGKFTGLFVVGLYAMGEASFVSSLKCLRIKQTMDCVNALKGATFISTRKYVNWYEDKHKKCQCPERGDLHFYTCLWEPA